MPLGLTAAWRDWAERLELRGVEWSLGRNPRCDIQVRHPSVPEVGAQALLRRGRLLVRPAGGGSVVVDGEPIRAPIAL